MQDFLQERTMVPREREPDVRVYEYVGRSLPGPKYRLTGSLAKARHQDRERIAALKRTGQPSAMEPADDR